MAWRASFAGPSAMNGACTMAEWDDAANWLRAMMEVVAPPRGQVEAICMLRGSPTGVRYLARAGDFWFKIEPERAAA